VIYGVTGDDRRRVLDLAGRAGEPNRWEVIGGLSEAGRRHA
jgi:hypothetical protein